MARAAGSDRRRAGIALCVVSACGFGLMAIFATRAYEAGLGVTTLLALRFSLAASIFWAIVAVRRSRGLGGGSDAGGARRPSRGPRRVALTALALGVGYSAQSGFFFSALKHIDVGLTSLLLYTFPAMVCLGAVALGRERMGVWKAGALGLASAGTALVLLGGGSGGLQATGVALGLAAGVTYSVYILLADDVVGSIDAWLFSALVATGGAVAVTGAGIVTGSLALGAASSWIWIACIALLSTVLPISTFLLGLERVGGPTASIVSTVEPVLTVTLAVALLGESLGPLQLLGGAFVIGAVIALQSRAAEPGVSVAVDGACTQAAGLAAARTPAGQAA